MPYAGVPMTRAKSIGQALRIPIALIPAAIADLIRKKGNAIYRISIVRTVCHYYNVNIRTKAAAKDPAPEAAGSPDGNPAPVTSRWRRTVQRRSAA